MEEAANCATLTRPTMSADAASGEITELLRRHGAGDREAFDRLVDLVYQRLRYIARGQRSRWPASNTLATTALVHEAYLDLVEETGVAWQDRGHFFAIAARAMRRILADYARRRGARKRGGGWRREEGIDLDQLGTAASADFILAVDEALAGLAAFDERLERVVECRFFAGLSGAETAAALAVSQRTVERDWARARAWLRRELA